MRPLKAIVLEPKLKQRAEYSQYSKFFSELGYECTPTFKSDEKEVSTSLADQNEDQWFVFICDLSLGAPSDKSLQLTRNVLTGHHVVAKLKRAYPEIFCILTSGATYPVGQIFDVVPNLDLYVSKELFSPGTGAWSRYQDEFRRKFIIDVSATFGVRNIYQKICETAWFKRIAAKKWSFTRKNLDSLLRQILFRGHNIDPQLQIGKIEIEFPSGGRSRSLVFKAKCETSNGAETIATIVKISLLEDARRERNNFEQFVKWHLSHLFRVDILGYGETEQWGAVAYSFAFGDEAASRSFTAYLRENNFDAARKIIGRLFSLSDRKWYAPKIIATAQDSLVQHYDSKLFNFDDANRMSSNVFDDIATKVLKAKWNEGRTRLIVGRYQYLNSSQLRRGAPVKYSTCIAHGDFNSNNIILAETKGKPSGLIFIDFQETGRAHVFYDFVVFEASLRWYYGYNSKNASTIYSVAKAERLSARDYLAWEKRLAQLEPGKVLHNAPQLFQLITQVRLSAHSNFPDEDWATYLYAVAAYNFRLLRVTTESVTPAQQTRAVCAVLAHLTEFHRLYSVADSRAENPL